jgi:hypothetical protein
MSFILVSRVKVCSFDILGVAHSCNGEYVSRGNQNRGHTPLSKSYLLVVRVEELKIEGRLRSMPQYLRVHRRRNAATPIMLQLDGISATGYKRNTAEQMKALADLSLLPSTAEAAAADPLPSRPRKRRTSALWRRVSVGNDEEMKGWNERELSTVVTNVVFEDEVGEDHHLDVRNAPKRCRLTLLDPKAALVCENDCNKMVPHKKKAGCRVLHPSERMVDDSLQQVAKGNRSGTQHLQFIASIDPKSSINWYSGTSSSTWLAWSNTESGNLLHACALWNDVDTCVAIRHQLVLQQQRQSPAAMPQLLLQMTEALDGDGRTPYDVAYMLKHEQVMAVLDTFVVEMGYSSDDFVVDVYCLDDSSSHDDDVDDCTTRPKRGTTGTTIDDYGMLHRVTCELQGGVGYWDEKGDLVLEPHDEREGGKSGERDDAGVDEDSNSENWDGNDYPEEERGFSDDDSGEEIDHMTFRNNEIQFPHRRYDGDDDNEYAHDAGYGIYGQDTEYDKEC